MLACLFRPAMLPSYHVVFWKNGRRSIFQKTPLGKITDTAANMTYYIPASSTDADSLSTQLNSKSGRYNLLSVAQRYSRTTCKDSGEIKTYRVGTCHKVVRHGFDEVSIVRNSNDNIVTRNVGVCGNPVQCPVCAHTLSSQRTTDVYRFMSANRARGGVCLFVTFTMSHSITDTAKDSIDSLNLARRHLVSGGSYKRLMKHYGFLGDIRTLEVTYSDNNGWHPHLHCVYFFEKLTTSDIGDITDFLQRSWKSSLNCFGRTSSLERGVKVDRPSVDSYGNIASYMAKWGREVGNSFIKKGRKGSYVPFDFLSILSKSYDCRIHSLWIEYLDSMHRRRNIHFSQSLIKLFGDIRSDNDVLNDESQDTHVLSIPRLTYRVMYFNGLFGRFLELCELSIDAATKYAENILALYLKYDKECFNDRKRLRFAWII